MWGERERGKGSERRRIRGEGRRGDREGQAGKPPRAAAAARARPGASPCPGCCARRSRARFGDTRLERAPRVNSAVSGSSRPLSAAFGGTRRFGAPPLHSAELGRCSLPSALLGSAPLPQGAQAAPPPVQLAQPGALPLPRPAGGPAIARTRPGARRGTAAH